VLLQKVRDLGRQTENGGQIEGDGESRARVAKRRWELRLWDVDDPMLRRNLVVRLL
jgi:hypothetical protein